MLIRPSGFRRAAQAQNYIETLKNSSPEQCVFCPGDTQDVLYRGNDFYAVRAKPAYEHFEMQEVIEHNLVIPNDHATSIEQLGSRALREMEDYVAMFREATPSFLRFQSFTREPDNPSKSQEHLHQHLFRLSLRPVETIEYNIHTGLTKLTFADLTKKQIEDLRRA